MRESVVWFAGEMERELRNNDYKGGWRECEVEELFRLLNEEVGELGDVLKNGGHISDARIISECADVANFAMMIADIVKSGFRLLPMPSPVDKILGRCLKCGSVFLVAIRIINSGAGVKEIRTGRGCKCHAGAK